MRAYLHRRVQIKTSNDIDVQSVTTVLIVDDDPNIREVLEALLITEGYQLDFAINGSQALSKTQEILPDLILLDVMMPDVDGFEVCRRLRANPQTAQIPIVMVTGLDDKQSRIEGIEAGADDFLSKPFNHTELRARVRTLTRLNHLRQMRTQELQAERDRTHAILEALGEAVVVTNLKGEIQYMNPAAEALTGFTYQEAIGQNWRQLWENKGPDEKLNDDIIDTVHSGQMWRGEVVNKRKDGTIYDAALTVVPLFSTEDRSQPTSFVSVQRDITPLKEAERAKTKFVSNVSHELRTPLSIITLLGDNLETLYDRLSDQKRLKMIQDIQKHTEALNSLIGDILEISRIDSGRISDERAREDVTQLTHQEVDKLMPLAQQNNQTLQMEGAEPLPVWGNGDQIRQVIRNLVNNALKYTPNGGQIICQCLSGPIQPPATQPHTAYFCPESSDATDNDEKVWAIVRVVDNGIGISPEHLKNMFGRFYRIKTQGNIRGTGLGLSIAKELVELHNGFITVASTPDQGSVFSVYLPLQTKE